MNSKSRVILGKVETARRVAVECQFSNIRQFFRGGSTTNEVHQTLDNGGAHRLYVTRSSRDVARTPNDQGGIQRREWPIMQTDALLKAPSGPPNRSEHPLVQLASFSRETVPKEPRVTQLSVTRARVALVHQGTSRQLRDLWRPMLASRALLLWILATRANLTFACQRLLRVSGGAPTKRDATLSREYNMSSRQRQIALSPGVNCLLLLF